MFDLSRRQLMITGGLATAATAWGVSCPSGKAFAATPITGDYVVEDLGLIPLETFGTIGQDFLVMDDGTPAAFMSVDGKPVTVAMVNPFTDELYWQLDIPASNGGSWAVRALPDGTVYVGTWSHGNLYRKLAHEDAFTLIGRPGPDVTWIWDMDVDDAGNVYLATYLDGYTSGRVYTWNETDGFRDYGPAFEGASAARAIEHHDGIIYVGTYPVNSVVAIDVETGVNTPLPLPPEPFGMLQDLRVVDGVLWMHQGGASTIAFDIATQEWLPIKVPGFGRGISGTGPDGKIYVDSHTDGLVAINPDTLEYESVGISGQVFRLQWLPNPDGGETLFGIQKNGTLISYEVGDPGVTTRKLATIQGNISWSVSLNEGPAGELWAASYMTDTYRPYDPAADTWGEQLQAMGQCDSMVTDGRYLCVGCYSGARVYRYDPEAPQSAENPLLVRQMSGDGQDRIHALGSADGRILAGTIPQYGELGGALMIHETATGETSVYVDIVPDQSLTSVLGHDNVIYAGSSVYGGGGSHPTQQDAVVIVVDPATGEVQRQFVPVPGQRAIRELVIGPDGALWGLAGGELFRTDLTTFTTTVVRSIKSIDWEPLTHYWAWGFLAVNPVTQELTGIAGLSGAGTVFSYNIATDQLTIHDEDAWYPFAQHSSGDFYWAAGRNLFRATLQVTPAVSLHALRTALEAHIADGQVAGPITRRLTDKLDLTARHVDAGRTGPAVVALDSFVTQLDQPGGTDTLTDAAADDLRSRAAALRALLT